MSSEEQERMNQPLNRDYLDSEYVEEEDCQENKKISSKKASIIEEKINQKFKFDGLGSINVWGYSVGHFYNDLCAAVWFNFLAFYLTSVRHLVTIAPFALLGGQLMDGITTPIVGILSDKTKTSIGKRTPWYLFGTVLVTFTFLPIFIFQLMPDSTPEWAKFIYYVTFPSLFNVGWASVQISNMSLVPSLTCCNTKRDVLNSRRNTFTFVANLAVLCVAGIFFIYVNGDYAFEGLALFVVTLGLSTTTFFLFTVKEVPLVKIATECQLRLNQQKNEDGVVQEITNDDEENNQTTNEALMENAEIDPHYENSPNQSQSKSRHQSNPNQSKQRSVHSNNSSQNKSNVSRRHKTNEEQEEEDEEMYRRIQKKLKSKKNPKKSMNSMSMGSMMLTKENDVDYEIDYQTGQLKESISSLRLKLKSKQLKQKAKTSHNSGSKNSSGMKKPLVQQQNQIGEVDDGEDEEAIQEENDWKQWFGESMFYICGIIYMFVRLYCNVIASVMQFYLLQVCLFKSKKAPVDGQINIPYQCALVPILMYVFSCLASAIVEKMFQKIGRKKTYFIGAFFAGLTCVGLAFIDEKYSYLVYPVACGIGIAQALCLNTGITLISDVIGCRGSQGAFVFGVYSFLDKVCTGVVMFVLFKAWDFADPKNADIVRWTMVLIPAVSCIVAGICISMIKTKQDEFKHSGDKKEVESNQQKQIE